LTNAEPSEDLASIPIAAIEPSVLLPAPVLKGKSASAEVLESSCHSSVSDEAAEDPTSTEDSDVENELVTESVSLRFDDKCARDLTAVPWRHLSTKKYHLPKADELGKLGCGKMINFQYKQVTEVPAFLFPRCEVCFSNALHNYVTPSSSSHQS